MSSLSRLTDYYKFLKKEELKVKFSSFVLLGVFDLILVTGIVLTVLLTTKTTFF